MELGRKGPRVLSNGQLNWSGRLSQIFALPCTNRKQKHYLEDIVWLIRMIVASTN